METGKKKAYRRLRLAEYGRIESLTLGNNRCLFGFQNGHASVTAFEHASGAHDEKGCSLGS